MSEDAPAPQTAAGHAAGGGAEAGPGERLRKIVAIVYALQAASFIVGITLIVGVVIDYVKREDARGTWLESHVRWQIRTFWFALLWGIIGALSAPFLVGWLVLVAAGVWVIYRIVKGWLQLYEGRPVGLPVAPATG